VAVSHPPKPWSAPSDREFERSDTPVALATPFGGTCDTLAQTRLLALAASATRLPPMREAAWGGHRTTIGQFRLTVTPFALTIAWKMSVVPRGTASSTLASPPIAAHQWS
jgi:hypothetical protein